MTVDYQALFNIAVVGISGLCGWTLKTMHEAMRDLQNADTVLADKVQHIEVLVAGQYVKRDELERLGAAIFQKLDRIENKLDGKVDK